MSKIEISDETSLGTISLNRLVPGQLFKTQSGRWAVRVNEEPNGRWIPVIWIDSWERDSLLETAKVTPRSAKLVIGGAK